MVNPMDATLMSEQNEGARPAAMPRRHVVYEIVSHDGALLARFYSRNDHPNEDPEEVFRQAVARSIGPEILFDRIAVARYQTRGGQHREGNRMFWFAPDDGFKVQGCGKILRVIEIPNAPMKLVEVDAPMRARVDPVQAAPLPPEAPPAGRMAGEQLAAELRAWHQEKRREEAAAYHRIKSAFEERRKSDPSAKMSPEEYRTLLWHHAAVEVHKQALEKIDAILAPEHEGPDEGLTP